MDALIYSAHGVLELGSVDEPVVGPGAALIHVRAVGICGSELESFATRSPVRVPPLVMGHEVAGVRASDGAAVAINPLVTCGSCDLCRRGRRNLCRARTIVGIHRSGGYAERLAVPAECARDLPPGVSFAQGAFVEPLANAVQALRLGMQHEPMPGRIGVIGAGSLGIACTLVASSRGVPFIEVADPSRARRRTALEAGAHSAVERLSGEFDIVIDAVGAAVTRSDSVGLLRPGGVAVWLGLHSAEPGFDSFGLVRFGKVVVGSFCYEDRDFDAATSLAARARHEWFSQVPLADGAAAFTRLLDGPTPHVKTMMVT
jgi:threonine dehydrogenase-like Zn-dependent dehydrogenase